MHNPVQIYCPDWNSKYCENLNLARASRPKVLKHAADNGTLLLPAHFGSRYCGCVRRSGEGYAFEPAPMSP